MKQVICQEKPKNCIVSVNLWAFGIKMQFYSAQFEKASMFLNANEIYLFVSTSLAVERNVLEAHSGSEIVFTSARFPFSQFLELQAQTHGV